MKLYLSLAVYLGLINSSWAEPMVWSGRMPERPPAEYAHRYEGSLTVHRIPLADISQNCRNIYRVLGCAYWDPAKLSYCTVYVPNDVPGYLEAAILEHELGHCNGWRHPLVPVPAPKVAS